MRVPSTSDFIYHMLILPLAVALNAVTFYEPRDLLLKAVHALGRSTLVDIFPRRRLDRNQPIFCGGQHIKGLHGPGE